MNKLHAMKNTNAGANTDINKLYTILEVDFLIMTILGISK